MKYVRKYNFLLSHVSMVNHGLHELLQPRYDENHRGKTIFTGTQVQNGQRCGHEVFTRLSIWTPVFTGRLRGLACCHSLL
jgi:hypothetical protein